MVKISTRNNQSWRSDSYKNEMSHVDTALSSEDFVHVLEFDDAIVSVGGQVYGREFLKNVSKQKIHKFII